MAELEKAVKEKTDELDDANRQLSIKMDTVKNLHVRDPLTGLFNRMYFRSTLRLPIRLKTIL